MKIVDKSSEIKLYDKKFMRRWIFASVFPPFLILGIMMMAVISIDLVPPSETATQPLTTSSGVILLLAYVVVLVALMFAAVVIGEAIRVRILDKYRRDFFNELSAAGFKCDEIFDSGKSTYADEMIGEKHRFSGNPAAAAVDYSRRELAIMFFYNPSECYIIPAEVIRSVESGKDEWGLTKDKAVIKRRRKKKPIPNNHVSASFWIKVNGVGITVPTKLMAGDRCQYVESRSREDYESGKVSKKFIEAVEKADAFASVLKNLTGLKQ